MLETAQIDAIGKTGGDTTVTQTVDDVRKKAKQVTLNKDGKPRKPYTRQGSPASAPQSPERVPSQNSGGGGAAGFTEEQVKASFKGLFSLVALGTDCNVWFLSDIEADCFIPSSTLALNQMFPSVAASKWGALSLASLSLMGVVVAKTLVYMQYKASLKKPTEEKKPENG